MRTQILGASGEEQCHISQSDRLIVIRMSVLKDLICMEFEC